MPDAPPAPSGACKEEAARRRIFLEFMTRLAQIEELVDGGRRFLARFRQELEYSQRPRVPIESGVMGEILKSNHTERMKSYLESGCSLHCQDMSNLSQLHSCEGELEGYISKANGLLKELECLVEEAYDATLTANLKALDDAIADNRYCFTEENDEQPADQLDHDSSLVTLMILVHNMLKQDYTMQEKIVRSVSLNLSSMELEGYCLMWDLWPYVDSNLLELVWKMCS